jgi:hypothetical protein
MYAQAVQSVRPVESTVRIIGGVNGSYQIVVLHDYVSMEYGP